MSEHDSSKQPATGAAAAAGEKDEGFSKVMRRMKTVLKSGSRSNRGSVSSLGGIMGESSKSASQPNPSSGTQKPKQPAQGGATGTAASGPASGAVRAHQRRDVQQERARVLFEKYGLTLDPSEWVSRPVNENVERVDKPIRMRVRRNCHRCLTNFGSEKLCPSCHHMRCNKCFRYPPAKQGGERATASATAAAGRDPAASKGKAKPAEPGRERKREKVVLTLPSRTGGQDLVRKPIRQRVRRNCHVCSTLFAGDATECENCNHIRCKKCPRDPPKPKKYPNGYPGDVEPPVERQERVYRKPRRRIRWTCHECNKTFSHGHKTCGSCQHERCERCIRDPPKKVKPEPDPDLLRRVEEKLARIDVSS